MDKVELPRLLRRPGVDRMLDVLGERQRRLVLRLLKREAVVHESDLMMRGSQEDVRIDLKHNHLPRLADAGYIEWDPKTGTISKGPRFEEIEPLLELIEEHSDELPAGWP